MKKSILILSFFCMIVSCMYAQPSNQTDTTSYITPKYIRRVQLYQQRWSKLIPAYAKIQFAGGMGVLSAGIGWDYGKNNQWETDLLFGFIPEFSGEKGYMTMTLKENYIPWRISLNRYKEKSEWMLEPFTVSLYINKIFGSEFWTKQPKRYPEKYYELLATNLRFNIAFGQRINLKLKHPHLANTMSFFYEVETSDLYVLCAIQNKVLKLHDIFSLSLGLKFQIM